MITPLPLDQLVGKRKREGVSLSLSLSRLLSRWMGMDERIEITDAKKDERSWRF
jgi:hypothetical protein